MSLLSLTAWWCVRAMWCTLWGYSAEILNAVVDNEWATWRLQLPR